MTREEIEMYYDLLGFKYEAAIGALYARELVDEEWVRESRKRFFDKLERERDLHFRRISDYEASMRLFFTMVDDKNGKYVSLTDIARKYSQDPPGYTIQSWMRSKNTIAYLRIWELINNYYFDDEVCAELIESSSKNSVTLTPSKWISSTKAIGIRVKRGKGGGVEAHEDIAMDFRLWIDPNFRHHLIWYVREH